MPSDDRGPKPDGVGYKRPPKHTQFKPGQSGNPKGRPKGTQNLKTDLREELGEIVRVREGDREILISKQRAFVKSLIASAVKGDTRAANALVSLWQRVLGGEEDLPGKDALAPVDQGILDEFIETEIKRRAKGRGKARSNEDGE